MSTKPTGNRFVDEIFREARAPIFAPGIESHERKFHNFFRKLENHQWTKLPGVQDAIKATWQTLRARAVRLAEDGCSHAEVLAALAGDETTDVAEASYQKRWKEIQLSARVAQVDWQRVAADILEAHRWRGVLLRDPFRKKRNFAIAEFRQKIRAGGDERYPAQILLRRVRAINELERLRGEVLSFTENLAASAQRPSRYRPARPKFSLKKIRPSGHVHFAAAR